MYNNNNRTFPQFPPQQLTNGQQQQQQQYSAQFASYSSSSSYAASTGGQQNSGGGQQQQFVQQQHEQQQFFQQQENLPPYNAQQVFNGGMNKQAAAAVTTQVSYVQSNQQRIVQGGFGGSGYPQQQQQQPMIQNAPYMQTPQPQPNQYYQQPSHQPQQQFQQPQMYQQPPQQSSSAPIITEPPEPHELQLVPQVRNVAHESRPQSPPQTNMLQHADGSLLIQEAFLQSGAIDFDTGYAHVLDLQGLWARVRSKNGRSSDMKLSFRMQNASNTGIYIQDLRIRFAPNCFGLALDPSVELLPVSNGSRCLAPGQAHTCAVTLLCTPENQRVPSDPSIDWTTIQMIIEYRFSHGVRGPSSTIRSQYQTLLPLHIFFQDHPQMEDIVKFAEPTSLSASDDGPRLTQSIFLEQWRSQLNQPQFTQTFQVSNVNWQRIYDKFARDGVVMSITGRKGPSPNPNTREIIRVMEHKLSMNRIFVIASRETQSQSALNAPDLVFYVSFKVGEMNGNSGSLILGEIRMMASDDASHWSACHCTLRSQSNQKLWPGIERAVKAILLS